MHQSIITIEDMLGNLKEKGTMTLIFQALLLDVQFLFLLSHLATS
jgi:hypothetical protein